MADRNPWIPAERARDMQTKEHDNEREAKERYAQKQAQLERDPNTPVPESGEEASEKPGAPADTGGKSDQETGNATR